MGTFLLFHFNPIFNHSNRTTTTIRRLINRPIPREPPFCSGFLPRFERLCEERQSEYCGPTSSVKHLRANQYVRLHPDSGFLAAQPPNFSTVFTTSSIVLFYHELDQSHPQTTAASLEIDKHI